MPPCTGGGSPGRRSAGRTCCARPSAWRCCTRGGRSTSGSWTGSWRCTTTPSGRLGMGGWGRQAGSGGGAVLEGRRWGLGQPYWREATADMRPAERDFTNLVNELVRLVLAEELFTFVLRPEVEPTNNAMERLLRNPALDRKAGRTNQTAAGAHR